MGAAETEEEVWASVDRADQISLGKDLNQETSKVNGDTVLKWFYISTISLKMNKQIFLRP